MDASPKRILFIDALRSLAIISMLQGHFIGLSYQYTKEKMALITTEGTSGSFFFDTWNDFRGMTAPLFFVISGVIFNYILCKSGFEVGSNKRVRYGVKRGLQLVFLGYLLQLNLRYYEGYLNGNYGTWVYGFHVLQSIGLSILIGLLLFYIVVSFKGKYIPWLYSFVGLGLFVFHSFIIQSKGDFPATAFLIIQNMFKGEYSVFPIVPWTGFYLCGGALGYCIYIAKEKVFSYRFMIQLCLVGLFLMYGMRPVLMLIDHVLSLETHLHYSSYLYKNLGSVMLYICGAIWIEKKGFLRNTPWLIIGQNTLWVYFLHVIILYGGIFGYGLRDLIKRELFWYQSVIGAMLFIAFFYGVLFLKEQLKNKVMT